MSGSVGVLSRWFTAIGAYLATFAVCWWSWEALKLPPVGPDRLGVALAVAAAVSAAVSGPLFWWAGRGKTGEDHGDGAAAVSAAEGQGLVRDVRLPPLRVLHRPPDLVPSTFLDRRDVLAQLEKQLEHPSMHFVALVGDPGVGKTAVVTELLQRLKPPKPVLPISTFEYISARGNRFVNVPTLIDVLAMAHPAADERQALLERVYQAEPSWWAKLDGVLRVLNGCRVLIVLDDCERLLDSRGEIADRSLHEFVERLSEYQDNAVQLLFVTSAHPKFRLPGFSPEDSLQIPAGLPPQEGVAFLSSLIPPGVGHTSLTQLYESADGRPRTLELISGMLAESGGDLASLMRAMQGVRGDHMALHLLDRIVDMLPEPDAWVLRALAIFGRPVPAAAVSELLERDCGLAIGRLADRRFVRVDLDAPAYYLPPDEAEHLVEGIGLGVPADRARTPRPRTQIALCHHAANYFTRLAEQTNVRRVEDLGRHFAAIGLRIQGGEHDDAFNLMNMIEDDYLEGWGHNDALLSSREQVEGHLGKANDEVDNLTRMAYAMSEREEHDNALDMLQRARSRNIDVRNAESPHAEAQYAWNELIITLEVAGTLFDAGWVTKAARLYASALREPLVRVSRVREAQARSGLGLCQIETAEFDEAIGNFTAGLSLIEHTADAEAASLRCELKFNMGVAELYRGPSTDPALATLTSAHRLAEELQDRVLAAQIVDTMALATIGIDDHRALAFAEHAATVGAETGSPELVREANGTLALIHLRLENTGDALAAANVAVEFWRTRRAFAGFALQGIALLRERQPGLAEGSFSQAHVSASELLREENNAYQLHEFDGLALAGLAVSTRSDAYLRQAEGAYCRARRITEAPGVVRLCLHNLNALLLGNNDTEFESIRAAAGSRKIRS